MSSDNSAPDNVWEQRWKSSNTPWDAASSTRGSLAGLLDTNDPEEDDFRSKLPVAHGSSLCLIPGCGRGYDALLWAKRGFSVHAVDISQTALTAAEKWLKSQQASSAITEMINFKTADFFAMDGQGQYQAAYDYTFFCAIELDQRAAWGQKYADLMAPGGMLLATMFPLDPEKQGGPPFAVSLEAYRQALEPSFELVAVHEPKYPVPSHKGKESFSLWRRSR